MATTTVAHASLIRYDSDGNQLVINLKNTGDDVSITGSDNSNLPSNVTSAQTLANALGTLAFKSSLSKSDIGLGNVDNTSDSSKNVAMATKLQTYKDGSTTDTYGSQYPLYAQWNSNGTLILKCDEYRVLVGYATSAASADAVAWENVTGKPSVYAPASHTHTKSQITDFPTSLPASDVSAWAKAASKPSYSKSEVGLGNVDNTADANKSVNYATTAGATTKLQTYKDGSATETYGASYPLYAQWSGNIVNLKVDNYKVYTDCARLAEGLEDPIYVSKTAPTKTCLWAKID
mgnify:CR=1 FL=1|nr:MAG TPA: Putative tail fiber protein [Caudoviricetes sp.]